jgi:hypothetical protein
MAWNSPLKLPASLQEFTASGVVELRENGGSVTPFSGMSWEVRGSGEKPLLHLWSEQFNLTRRVLAITDHSEHRLEFIRREFERDAHELSRQEFRDRSPMFLPSSFQTKRWNHCQFLRISDTLSPAITRAEFSGGEARTLPFYIFICDFKRRIIGCVCGGNCRAEK